MKSLDKILEKLSKKYGIEESNSGHNEFVDENGKASKLTIGDLIRLIDNYGREINPKKPQ